MIDKTPIYYDFYGEDAMDEGNLSFTGPSE